MTSKQMIFRRRSVRSFEERPVSRDALDDLMTFISGVKRLTTDVRVQITLLDPADVTTVQKWDAPHVLALFSEEKPLWLENAGFMLQQVDLYLQSRGMGSCWVGLGYPKEELTPEGMKHVILMVFGYPRDVPERNDISQFKRKQLAEISDVADSRLESVRIAPSACNSQPWYFVHDGEQLHVYREELTLLKKRTMNRMNQIDMGIALAHLYTTFGDSFSFQRLDRPPEKEGYLYIGTVQIP